jgi:hypothetical protein
MGWVPNTNAIARINPGLRRGMSLLDRMATVRMEILLDAEIGNYPTSSGPTARVAAHARPTDYGVILNTVP